MKASASMKNSNRPDLPPKPYDGFPLYCHQTDRWAKKVRGKTRFFGKATTDPTGQAALEEWNLQKDYLLAGQEPPAKDEGGITLADLCNAFLRSKKTKTELGK